VKLLFDHCVPKPFRRELIGHEVKTAYQMGWSNLSNGKLLAAGASGTFDAFITVDQNLRHQQNLSSLPLAVIVLVAVDNAPVTLAPYGKFVLEVLNDLTPRSMICIYGEG
jgi:hypothetical protein